MHGVGTDRSVLKDWATSIMGNLAAVGHSVMPDEILKNHFSNYAFENFETFLRVTDSHGGGNRKFGGCRGTPKNLR